MSKGTQLPGHLGVCNDDADAEDRQEPKPFDPPKAEQDFVPLSPLSRFDGSEPDLPDPGNPDPHGGRNGTI